MDFMCSCKYLLTVPTCKYSFFLKCKVFGLLHYSFFVFFCQAPAQPRACGGGCAGRYTLLFMAWFVLLSDSLLCLKGVDFLIF